MEGTDAGSGDSTSPVTKTWKPSGLTATALADAVNVLR